MQTFDHDGLRWAYEDSGAPEQSPARHRPVAVLVHGWCNTRQDMAPLAAGLSATYRTIAMDAAGHGDSDVPSEADATSRLGIGGQAAAVLGLLDRLGIARAVLIGHSSGGAVALELAALRPGLAEAVVCLDGTVLFTEEARSGADELLAALSTPAWREVMSGFLEASHLPGDDPAALEKELADLARMQQHVVRAVPEGFDDWDAEAALRSVAAQQVPLLYVDASRMARLDRMAELVPDLAVARTTDVGHMQLVAHPGQALAAIEDFLRVRLARPMVDNSAPLLELWAALDRGDLSPIDHLVSADFVDHGAPPGMVEPGPQGYRTILGMLREQLELRWEVLAVVASGERVMTWVRNTGRHVGPFLGLPPSGRDFSFEAMHIFRVEDGVIREHWAVRDDLSLFTQLGVSAPAMA